MRETKNHDAATGARIVVKRRGGALGGSAIGLVLCLFINASLRSEDWPSFRGPHLNGYTSARDWRSDFSGDDLPLAWKTNVGIGASGVVVAGNRGVTMGAQRQEEINSVICFETESGQPIWSFPYPCRFERRMFDGGTAATPTIDRDRVYTLAHDGQVHCLDFESGRLLWSRHLVHDFGGRYSRWKYSGSPMVQGDLVIFDTGSKTRSTVALNRADGSLLWGSGSDKAGYGTPIPFRQGDVESVVLFKAKALVALNMASGEELWRVPWKSSYDVNASTPISLGDRLFVSSGYGSGRGVLLRLTSGEPELEWKNIKLKTKTSSAVVIGNVVYGVSESGGKLMALDLESGAIHWSQRGFGGGTLIGGGDKLIVLGSRGNLAMVAADPEAYRPLVEVRLLKGTCWVAPTLAHGRLFCKNNRGDLVCMDLRKKRESE